MSCKRFVPLAARPRCGVLSLCVLSAFLFACRTAPASSSPTVAVTADTWAVVNGREIKRDEIEKAFRRVSQPGQPLSDEEALTAKLTVLNDFIVQDILLAKARELKVELQDKELDTAFAEAKKNIPDETFQQQLTRRNLSPADMREGLRRELLSQKVIEREVTSKISITDQDISDFYNANKAQFNFAEEAFRLAQIVVTPVRDPQVNNQTGDDATTPQTAMSKAQMLMTRLKEGAAFGDLARDFSEDPETAARGGDLGFMPLSALKQAPPALRDAVMKLSPGSVRVVSVGGAHTIVLLVAREPAGQRDLSTPGVRENITNALRGRREQLLRTAYLSAVRSDAKVENYLARRLVESQGKMPSLGPSAPAGR